MSAPHFHQAHLLGLNRGDDPLRTSVNDVLHRLHRQPTEATDTDTGDRASDDDRSERGHAAAGDQHLSPAASTELISITPRRELWSQRLADSYELRSVAELREPDVLRRH